jgi:hypothetical protein
VRKERGRAVQRRETDVVVQLEEEVVGRSRRRRAGNRVEPVVELVSDPSKDLVAVTTGSTEVDLVEDDTVHPSDKDHVVEEGGSGLRSEGFGQRPKGQSSE